MTQPAKVRSIRLTDAEWAEYKRRGGTDWLRRELRNSKFGSASTLIIDVISSKKYAQ